MTNTKANRCGYAAIVGRPNVGKSTLLNRILGQKLAITSHKAQTSRHNILGIKTLDEGQIMYVDTPGIHKRGDGAMNRYLNRSARSMLSDVNALIFVVEALKWTDEDEAILTDIKQRGTPCLLIINKVDILQSKERLIPYIAKLSAQYEYLEIIPISAKSGAQVDVLEHKVLSLLPEAENFYPDDQLTDRSERFFVSELLREQLTRRYADELPYSLSVEIEAFSDEEKVTKISAIVWVEKPGQKSILIGKKGLALKEASTNARLAMETFLGRKVYLKVWVKVKKRWSNDEAALSRLGYSD